MRNARRALQTGNLGQDSSVAIAHRARRGAARREPHVRLGTGVSMARGRRALDGDFIAAPLGTGAALRRGPVRTGQGDGGPMRYYTVIPLLLAPLAGACTPDSMAAPGSNEST